MTLTSSSFFFFFFNDTATTEIYTLSLHDALPICFSELCRRVRHSHIRLSRIGTPAWIYYFRSEEHTSELQSPDHLVCRLLLEKKKKLDTQTATHHARVRSLSPIFLHTQSTQYALP